MILDAMFEAGIPTPAREPRVLTDCGPCPGCRPAAIQAATEARVVVCAACGATYEPEAVPAPSSATERVPSHERKGADRSRPRGSDAPLRAVVTELLAWDFARNHCGGRASRSSIAGVLEVIRSGIVGDGNRGTKGTWRGGAAEVQTRTVPVSTATAQRYAALSPELRAIADAVIEDGGGCSLRPLALIEAQNEKGRGLAIELGLEARVGWRLADERQREKWLKKILRKDKAPAIEGMEQGGRDALEMLANAWIARAAA